MTPTVQKVFCTGCNLVIAPNAPGSYESQEGYGRVHGKACEAKAAKNFERRSEAQRSLRITIRELRSQCSALADSARLGSESYARLPKEITVGMRSGVMYTAEEFADVLRAALQTLYDACMNGKSHLRPQIMTFAAAATKALGCRVRVREIETPSVTTVNRVARFAERAAKARPAATRRRKR